MTRPATGPLTENVPVLISLIFGFLDTDINVPGENIALINYDITANFVHMFQTIHTLVPHRALTQLELPDQHPASHLGEVRDYHSFERDITVQVRGKYFTSQDIA